MTNRVFVFCIGGTGLRVMKSIMMLLASGVKTNGFMIVPIIIDPHNDLKEKKDLNILIDEYKKIYNLSIKSKDTQTSNALNGFFGVDVERLEDLNDQQNDTFVPLAEERSFTDFLGLQNIGVQDVNRYLVKTLFSETNLNKSLSVGFKGNPNVGTVVLSEIVNGSAWFKAFKKHCQDGDRVFIISSIFGGTGASGYPLIEKLIDEEKDNPNVKKAIMGAVSVLPYFTLKDQTNKSSDIDSATFLTKTKAALSYYEKSVKSDYLYYVGDKNMSASYDNDESVQKDTANFIELVAASALFHFVQQGEPTSSQYFSRAIKEDNNVLTLSTAGDSYKPLIKAVADMMMLKKLVDTLPIESQFPLTINRHWNDKFWADNSFITLKNFLNIFENWYEELADNKRSFSPLDFKKSKNEISNSFIKNFTIQGANDISQYLLEIIIASNHDKEENNENHLRQLLKFSYKAINKYTSQL